MSTHNVQTLSIICGSSACNARCPHCVSKMTPANGVKIKEPEVNWKNFKIACRLAEKMNATTAMLTGKGEPTLFPNTIARYLEKLQGFNFPLVELQTNGIVLAEESDSSDAMLGRWRDQGLTTIAISIVHFKEEKNRQIYSSHTNRHFDLGDFITKLHGRGYSVRLSCVLMKKFIDDCGSVEKLIKFAKDNNVEQLTLTPVNRPISSTAKDVLDRVQNEFVISSLDLNNILDMIKYQGTFLTSLIHGAMVFDYRGQNVCMNNCLQAHQEEASGIRNLIFYPDGHIRYDWQHSGAIIL